MFALRNPSIVFFALLALSAHAPAIAQTGTVRGYPAGTMLQQSPYYSAYYPMQYGYAYSPATNAAAYQAAYPTIRLAPQTAYYAPAQPVAAAARPAANYTLTPAGGISAGSEAFAYYGQSTPLNYVAPTYPAYQTRTVQVPVTYYRPYTVYQPGMAAPVTYQRAACGTVAQPASRCCCLSCFDWLFHRNHCAAPAAVPVAAAPIAAVPVAVAPAVVPRTVCYGNSCAPPPCGTPYYNTVPPATVVPGTTVVPGATVVPGTTVAPSTVAPPSGVRGILTPSTIVPPPGTRTIVPGTTIPDGSTIRPTLPPGTTVPAPGGFGPGGANYRPADRGNAPVASDDAKGVFVRQEASTTPAQGSSASRDGAASSDGPVLNRPTISEPSLGPRRSVQPVPDPAGSERLKRENPANRAPQLIDPSDRTAATRGQRSGQTQWGVVEATWPEKAPPDGVASRGGLQRVRKHVPAPAENVYDDTLWRSAAE